MRISIVAGVPVSGGILPRLSYSNGFRWPQTKGWSDAEIIKAWHTLLTSAPSPTRSLPPVAPTSRALAPLSEYSTTDSSCFRLFARASFCALEQKKKEKKQKGRKEQRRSQKRSKNRGRKHYIKRIKGSNCLAPSHASQTSWL